MNRVCGQVLAGLWVAACGGVVVSACTHDDSTIFVRDVLAPQPVAAGQVCSFTSDPTQPFIESGVLDVSLRPQYDATFLVGNQMVPEGNPSTPTTETSFVNIQGAVVRITDSDGDQLNTYTRLAGATLSPASGTTPSYGPISVTILDDVTVNSMSGLIAIGDTRRLITYTRFFGKTLGGQSVESNEFEFPVDLCRECLISFPVTEQSAQFPTPNCQGSGVTASTLPVPCILGEDTSVDCSVCLGTFAACNGAAAGVTIADAGTD